MVFLISQSNINQSQYPLAFEWDSLVRKHYNQYQKLIDAQTYQIQRLQRYLFKLYYPKHYDTDLVTLKVLEKKQEVGEVTKNQLKMYEEIDPNIRKAFKRTFSGNLNLPIFGMTIGTGLLMYSSYFNFSIPVRTCLFTFPILINVLTQSRDSWSEVHTSNFLEWVIQYRKARAFNERYQEIFANTQTQKMIGNRNVVELGKSLVKLAQ